MAKRILLIAAALLLLGFLYVGYTTYDAGRTGANGDVYSTDGTASKNKRAAASDASHDIGSEVKPQGSDPSVYPVANQPLSATTPVGQNAQPGVAGPTGATPPANDTISPNPPNGMVFSGTGHYQLYRQGNITWRLNTDNGQSCVLFATDEEWKKPRVIHAGCGRN